jgi:hypothetical protein
MDRSPTPPPVRWSLALRAAAPAPTTPTTPDRAWLGTRPVGPRPEPRPLALAAAPRR